MRPQWTWSRTTPQSEAVGGGGGGGGGVKEILVAKWISNYISSKLSIASTMQCNKFDPGSSANNFNSITDPFSVFPLMEQEIAALVMKMGAHTPTAKIQQIHTWFINSKSFVEQQHQAILTQQLSLYFPPGIPYTKKSPKFLELQTNGKFWLQQRVHALETARKSLSEIALLSETWASLMTSNPDAQRYVSWVKNSASIPIPDEMEEILGQVGVMTVSGKGKH